MVEHETIPIHRPFRKWIILWLAWIAGMGVWVLYLGMIFMLIYRLFASG